MTVTEVGPPITRVIDTPTDYFGSPDWIREHADSRVALTALAFELGADITADQQQTMLAAAKHGTPDDRVALLLLAVGDLADLLTGVDVLVPWEVALPWTRCTTRADLRRTLTDTVSTARDYQGHADAGDVLDDDSRGRTWRELAEQWADDARCLAEQAVAADQRRAAVRA